MNMYLIGIVISMIIYLVVGMLAGRAVKDKNDYYVAGRNAPTILIVGSLVASFLSTGAFLGDTGEVYSGFFMPILIVGVMQTTGYLYGSTMFGRYVRRSEALTLPEYFGKRFNDKKVQMLAGITTVFACTAYMLSAMQGISTLMESITGLEYSTCVLIAWAAFAIFTIWSGSSGVLITDTMMFIVFLIAAIIGIPFIIKEAGGWFTAIENLAQSVTTPGIISAGGNLDYLYPTGGENLAWAVTYGVVWALVVAISPWQTSRYMMAKNEKTVLKSAVWAFAGVLTVTTLLYFTAAFVQSINPDLVPSQSMIWAAMNIMPKVIGVIFLTGVLAAGISSASTFLSLIGFSVTNDIFSLNSVDVKKQLNVSRLSMMAVSFVVLILAYFNPPQIFWIMYFGGTVIASAWAVVAFASIWSKKISAAGAFWGMLAGFLGAVVMKLYSLFTGVTLPIYLDPFFIGIVLSIIGVIVGTKLKPRSEIEAQEFEKLHQAKEDIGNMKKYAYGFMIFAALFIVLMFVLYVIPYNAALK